MRGDFLIEGMDERLVFESAVWRSRWGQIIRKVGEAYPIGTKGKTAQRHDGVVFVISQISSPGPGGARYQPMSLSLAKLQQDVCCEIVGGIFRMPKYWHIEYIEGCVSDFM